jgi:hypothetical protein
VALDGLRGAVGRGEFGALAELCNERRHAPSVLRVGLGSPVRAGIENGHY